MTLNIKQQSEMFNRKTGGKRIRTDGKKAANNPAGCPRIVDNEGRVIRPALEER
jgi:hypothetical protein